MPTNVKDVDTARFVDEVIQRSHEIPVVVDFWAEWCGPCKVLGPVLEKLAAESGGAFELAKVDVDRNQQLAMEMGVQGIPTVVAFKDGRPVARFTGALPEAQVRQWLEQLLPTPEDLRVQEADALAFEGKLADAEAIYREVLSGRPGHLDAGVGLAGLLIDQGRNDEAEAILRQLPPTEEVQKLMAITRLGEAAAADLDELAAAVARQPDDPGARLAYGKALAAQARHEEALAELLEAVRLAREAGDEETKEAARQAMVDVFGLLGHDHPLTARYRAELANLLF